MQRICFSIPRFLSQMWPCSPDLPTSPPFSVCSARSTTVHRQSFGKCMINLHITICQNQQTCSKHHKSPDSMIYSFHNQSNPDFCDITAEFVPGYLLRIHEIRYNTRHTITMTGSTVPIITTSPAIISAATAITRALPYQVVKSR